ncbi:hypothetical protein ACX9R5_09380 [Rathayibacter sp. CAU 1779]
MTPETLGDAELLAALRRMWEQNDPPPEDLDALALAAVERAELDDDLIVLELFSEDLAFANVRGVGERTLRFVSGGYEVLLRIVREPEGFRIDGWSTPPTEGVVHVDVDGRERASESDALGRFAFTRIAPGRAVVSLTVAPNPSPVWATSAFAL